MSDIAVADLRGLYYYPFGMQMPGRKYSAGSAYRYGFNGQEKSEDVTAGNYTAEYWEYDSRIGRRWNLDPKSLVYESGYVVNHDNPILLNDPLGDSPGNPNEYTVKKGDNLSEISKRVGVSVDDLVKMNKIKDKNKISIGQALKINPEADFTNNPRGGYSNPNNSKGVEMNTNSVFAIGAEFPFGIGPENQIIKTGAVMDKLRKWDKVEELVTKGASQLWKDGRLTPGETFSGTYKSPNIPTWLHNQTDDKFADKKFFSPQHVMGSFNLSMRVTNRGSVRICIYDAKTISSMSDAILGKMFNRKNKDENGRSAFSTQYQRFIWDVLISF